jgi:hypothetical protein
MQSAMIEKMKDVARNEHCREKDVVYFLVEAYKLLEQVGKLQQFSLIRFYRNWACHSVLTKDSEKIFEEIYIVIKAKKYLSFPELEGGIPPFIELVDNIFRDSFNKYSFKELKKEIAKFCEQFLDNQMVSWNQFRKELYDVITDTPLVIREGKEELFRFICREITDNRAFDSISISIDVKEEGTLNFAADDDYFEPAP